MSKKYVGVGTPSVFNMPMDPLRQALSIGKYETRSRLDCSGTGIVLSSGLLGLTPIWLPTGLAVTSITFCSGTTAGSGLTHSWYGLYNNSQAQLATTADDSGTATWAASSTRTLNIATIAAGASASFTTTYEGLYYVGLCIVGTTVPTYYGMTAAIGATTISPSLGGTNSTARTTPPAFPFTAPTANQSSPMLWGYVN
jgi:hypothetical protein